MKSLSPWTIYGRAGSSTKQFTAIPSRQPKTMIRRSSQGGNWAERGGSAGEMLGTSGDNTLMATAPSVEIQALTETPALSIENIQAWEQITFGFAAEVSDS